MWAISKHRTFSKGFTLIELVVVIAVIGILAAVTVIGYRGVQDRARSAAMNTTADQWAKAIDLQILRSPPSTNMNWGYGRMSCLGKSAADFPARDGFGAGRCIDYIVPGHSDTALDSLSLWGEAYLEAFYTDGAWWTNKQRTFDGLLDSPTELQFSNGAKMRQRGVVGWVDPDANDSRSYRDRVRVLWIVASGVECAQGKDATVDWFNNKIKSIFGYPTYFPGSTTITSGKMCIRDISFD